jgi:cyclic pyranopterin phosphate synthase
MPKEIFGRDYQFLPKTKLLTFEEIYRLAKIFIGLGARKIRLTGGEPLLRREIETLIAMLASLSGIDLTLTTNGALLPQKAQTLKEAGLKRVTISLDSLDEEVFRIMNDVDFPVQQVLEGIQAAAEVGLQPIKVNMVVQRGVNDHEILPMVRYFRASGHILRFIEYMDVGTTNGWRLDDVVPAAEILKKVNAEFPIEPIEPNYRGEVAKRWQYKDGSGELGIVASVTQAFCQDCSRARLSADGKLFTCLFAADGIDLRAFLRTGISDEELQDMIINTWRNRVDRYSEIRSAVTETLHKIEMSYIGG